MLGYGVSEDDSGRGSGGGSGIAHTAAVRRRNTDRAAEEDWEEAVEARVEEVVEGVCSASTALTAASTAFIGRPTPDTNECKAASSTHLASAATSSMIADAVGVMTVETGTEQRMHQSLNSLAARTALASEAMQ